MNEFRTSRISYMILRASLGLTFAIGVLEILTDCTPVKLQSYTAQPVDRYPNVQVKNGLAVAAHPLTDKQESEKYFGVDLVSSDILAVYVSAENRNPSSSFVLSPEKSFVRFGNDEGKASGVGSPRTGREGMELESALMPMALVASVVPAAVLVVAPMALVSQKRWLNGQAIKAHFLDQELPVRTLPPAGQAQGFVYLQIHNPQKESRTGIFHFEAMDTKTHSQVEYDFPLEINQKPLR